MTKRKSTKKPKTSILTIKDGNGVVLGEHEIPDDPLAPTATIDLIPKVDWR